MSRHRRRTQIRVICFPVGENTNAELITIHLPNRSMLNVHIHYQSNSANNSTPDDPVQSSENHQTQSISSTNNAVQERTLATYDIFNTFLSGIRDQVDHFQLSHFIPNEGARQDLGQFYSQLNEFIWTNLNRISAHRPSPDNDDSEQTNTDISE